MAKYIDVTEAIKVAEDMRKVAEIAGNAEAFEMLIQFLKDREIVFQTPDEESSSADKGIKISNVVQNGSGSNSITISGKEVGKNLKTVYVNDGEDGFINCISKKVADKLFGGASGDKVVGRYGNKSIVTAVEEKDENIEEEKFGGIPVCPECRILFNSNGICARCGRSRRLTNI